MTNLKKENINDKYNSSIQSVKAKASWPIVYDYNADARGRQVNSGRFLIHQTPTNAGFLRLKAFLPSWWSHNRHQAQQKERKLTFPTCPTANLKTKTLPDELKMEILTTLVASLSVAKSYLEFTQQFGIIASLALRDEFSPRRYNSPTISKTEYQRTPSPVNIQPKRTVTVATQHNGVTSIIIPL